MSETIGIVAGWGHYPLSVAMALKSSDHKVVVAAIEKHADPRLQDWSDAHRWIGIGKLGAQQRLFREFGVRKVVLAGKLFKDKMLFHGRGWIGLMPDLECCRTFFSTVISRRHGSNDDRLLTAVVDSYRRQGIEIIPGTDFAPNLLAGPGNLTRTKPSTTCMRDIEFGWRIAKQMGGFDIGQSITVRDQTVLAVEAIEGTDACIARTGTVCPRGGFSLIKVSKPQQDRRFDQPTIGIQTIERMKKNGGLAIAIEAGETIIVDQEEVIRQADAARIAIISLSSNAMKT
jgi:UDP-2,3-diacylglucosamine hydrolase